MKTLLLCLCFLSTYCFSQDQEPLATTEEEYNYMRRGFRVQTESGLDMKKGYSFEDSEPITIGNYTFNLKILIREERNEIAGILVVTKSKVSGNTYYVAIPTGNEDLMAKYYAVLDDFDSSLLTAYSYVLSAYLGAALSTAHEVTKDK